MRLLDALDLCLVQLEADGRSVHTRRQYERHVRLLASLGLETGDGLPPTEEVLSAIRMDKKYRGGARFVLLEDVGHPFVEDAVPQELLRAALDRSGSSAQAMGG